MPRRGQFPGCGSPAHAFSRVTRHYRPAAVFLHERPRRHRRQLFGRLAALCLQHPDRVITLCDAQGCKLARYDEATATCRKISVATSTVKF